MTEQLDTHYIKRCLAPLQRALEHIAHYEQEAIEFDMYLSAVIKEFEIVLEQGGQLLKKKLRPYFHSNKAADALFFKDVFRQAGVHGLLTIEQVERWLAYRDSRNSTAHD